MKEAGYPKGAIADKPFAIQIPLPEESAELAYERVLKYAGANFPKRDAVDARVIQETATGTATGKGVFGKPGIIDHPLVVGGWPVYGSTAAPADTDNDGMPDAWEIAHGLNANNAADRNQLHSSGYTMLEMYLNELVKEGK